MNTEHPLITKFKEWRGETTWITNSVFSVYVVEFYEDEYGYVEKALMFNNKATAYKFASYCLYNHVNVSVVEKSVYQTPA